MPIQATIPKYWKQVKLGDIGSAIIGLTYSPNDVVKKGGILVLRSSNIRGNKIDYNDQVKVNLEIPKGKLTQKGDILICARNGSKRLIGKNAYIDEKSCGNAFGAFMSIYRTDQSKYVSWFFQTNEYQRQIARDLGPTINQVTTGNLNSFKILLPPLPEQEKIVEVLEAWDEYLEKLASAIKLKKVLRKQLIKQLISGSKRIKGFIDLWKKEKIGNVAEIVSGSTPSTTNSNYWNGNIYWITPTEITKLKNKYIYDTARKITEEGLNSCSAKVIPPKSLILCSRATVGDCAINLNEITTNQGFKNLIPKPEKVDVFFLYFWMLTKKHYLKSISSGSTFLEFSKTDLAKTIINLPSYAEQTAIAQILTAADQEIEALEKKRELIEAQKKFLLNNLVTGKIRLPEFIK